MRRRRQAVQRDLFEPDSPARAIEPEQRARLMPLLEVLLGEVMASERASADRREGGHEHDHA